MTPATDTRECERFFPRHTWSRWEDHDRTVVHGERSGHIYARIVQQRTCEKCGILDVRVAVAGG